MKKKNILFILLLLSKCLYSNESEQGSKTIQEDKQTKIETKKTFVEKWTAPVVTTLWATGVSIQSLCYASRYIRYRMYGEKPGNERTIPFPYCRSYDVRRPHSLWS